MQIQLSDTGPAMWFLGKPGDLKVSLSFADRGPVEVDFNKLEAEEQKQVLVSLRDGKITSDMKFQDLYEVWLKSRPAVSEPSPEVKAHLANEKKNKLEDKRMKLEAQRRTKEEKFQKRCLYLSKKSANALKAALKDKDDLRLFRTLRDLEMKRKRPRASVRDYLESTIRKLQKEVVSVIADSANKEPLPMPKGMTPKETITFDVIESEQEIVEFPIEDLADFAAGKPLGGE